MMNSLDKLTQKYVLLSTKFEIEYSAESMSFPSGFFEFSTARDAEKIDEKYKAKRARFMRKISSVKEKIIFRIRKGYKYDSLDDEQKEKVDAIIAAYVDNMDDKVKEMLSAPKEESVKKL